MANRDIANMRRDYALMGLTEEQAGDNPFSLFAKWLADADVSDILECNAMTLATVNAEGQPSARTVLLKGWDERGFVFYTNHTSQKAQDMEANPQVSLNFLWGLLERQVRIRGVAERASDEESDAYFQTRPEDSRLAAWASKQSDVLESRESLEARFAELRARFEGQEIPRPPFWGGYRVVPAAMEFWQGRPNRMHDRLRFTREGDGWKRERLNP